MEKKITCLIPTTYINRYKCDTDAGHRDGEINEVYMSVCIRHIIIVLSTVIHNHTLHLTSLHVRSGRMNSQSYSVVGFNLTIPDLHFTEKELLLHPVYCYISHYWTKL